MRMHDYEELMEAYKREGIDASNYYWYTDQVSLFIAYTMAQKYFLGAGLTCVQTVPQLLHLNMVQNIYNNN